MIAISTTREDFKIGFCCEKVSLRTTGFGSNTENQYWQVCAIQDLVLLQFFAGSLLCGEGQKEHGFVTRQSWSLTVLI